MHNWSQALFPSLLRCCPPVWKKPRRSHPELISSGAELASLARWYTTRLRPSLLRAISIAKNWILVAGKKSFLGACAIHGGF